MKSTLSTVGVGSGVALLALGGAFLLGVSRGRRARPAQRARGPNPALLGQTARLEPAPEPEPIPAPMARETPETTGVGSPIGDAPYAGGSRY